MTNRNGLWSFSRGQELGMDERSILHRTLEAQGIDRDLYKERINQMPLEIHDNEKFDVLVFIGRFSPFHHGHYRVIEEATRRAHEVIVIVGSSFEPRTLRNPFTFEERKEMIKRQFPTDAVKVVPSVDYLYDENKWIASIQSAVRVSMSFLAGPHKIGLIGHEKDGTSYYLKIFPTWKNVSVPNYRNINSTDIREKIFSGYKRGSLDLPLSSVDVIERVINRVPEFGRLFEEYTMIKRYKESWKSAPFPPTFVTVDTVVVQSGHILMVKRGAMPGKGLWALPGGFLNQEETLLDGAIRELKEETKIKVPVPVLKGSIKSQKTFDHPFRSSRGRTITTAYYIDLGFDTKLPKVTGADDAEKAKWIPFNQLDRSMVFEDHYHIADHFINMSST